MSDSLQPHGLQDTRLPCSSLSHEVCSNSCPLSQWCHPAISSSIVPFSSCSQSFPASGSFLSQLFTSVLWPPDGNSWLIRKELDAGNDWRQEEKGMTEDEMFRWHHGLNGHKFEQALGDGEGEGSLACYSLWGHKELDMTEQLNWTEVLLLSLLPLYRWWNWETVKLSELP